MRRRDRLYGRRPALLVRMLAVQVAAVAALVAVGPAPAWAHEGPDKGDAAWLMADWMLLSFLVFALAALVCFVVALKRGLLRNLEHAKYHILSIDEPDYYTPSWAREVNEDDPAVRTARIDARRS